VLQLEHAPSSGGALVHYRTVKETPDNPASNRLPRGVNDQDMVDAVSRSGYPLQVRVAAELADGFSIVEEWGYIDRDTKEPRSLDVHAYVSTVHDAASQYHPELILLIECKRSDLPFVFFQAAVPRIPREYPGLFGFRRNRFELYKAGQGYRDATASEFLSLRDLPFVSQGPPVSRAFAKAERGGKALDLSGEVPYRTVLMPLASALHHWAGIRKVDGDQQRYFPSLTLMLCVLDAPMVVATGRADNPELTLHPWIRVVRQESYQEHMWTSYRHYVVDFVHVSHLSTFIAQNVLPFAREVSARIEEAKPLLIDGRGAVNDWERWKWGDISPVPR